MLTSLVLSFVNFVVPFLSISNVFAVFCLPTFWLCFLTEAIPNKRSLPLFNGLGQSLSYCWKGTVHMLTVLVITKVKTIDLSSDCGRLYFSKNRFQGTSIFSSKRHHSEYFRILLTNTSIIQGNRFYTNNYYKIKAKNEVF